MTENISEQQAISKIQGISSILVSIQALIWDRVEEISATLSENPNTAVLTALSNEITTLARVNAAVLEKLDAVSLAPTNPRRDDSFKHLPTNNGSKAQLIASLYQLLEELQALLDGGRGKENSERLETKPVMGEADVSNEHVLQEGSTVEELATPPQPIEEKTGDQEAGRVAVLAIKDDPSARQIYESSDKVLRIYEDRDGHLIAVDAGRLV